MSKEELVHLEGEVILIAKGGNFRVKLENGHEVLAYAAGAVPETLGGAGVLFAFGDESYVHDLIARAGGRSATANIGTEAPVLSDEFVLKAQPDVIIGTYGLDYDIRRLLTLHPTWDVVPAVQHNRVYTIDPDLILRPGPRLVDGTEALARLLHPALFASDTTFVPDTPATVPVP